MQTDLSHSQLKASLFVGMTSYQKERKLHEKLTDEKAESQKNFFSLFQLSHRWYSRYSTVNNNSEKNLRHVKFRRLQNSRDTTGMECTCSMFVRANKTKPRPEYFKNLFSKYAHLFFVFQKSYTI